MQFGENPTNWSIQLDFWQKDKNLNGFWNANYYNFFCNNSMCMHDKCWKRFDLIIGNAWTEYLPDKQVFVHVLQYLWSGSSFYPVSFT